MDDGSVDGTREWLASLSAREPDRVNVILRTKQSRGSQRGSALLVALRWGLSIPDHAWFVEMDGDLSHRPEEIVTGLDLLRSGRAEVAIASKYVAGSQVTNGAFGRRTVSAVCNMAVRLLPSRAGSPISATDSDSTFVRPVKRLIARWFITAVRYFSQRRWQSG